MAGRRVFKRLRKIRKLRENEIKSKVMKCTRMVDRWQEAEYNIKCGVVLKR